ncbi:hypothetical protein [Rhizobium nepotum]
MVRSIVGTTTDAAEATEIQQIIQSILPEKGVDDPNVFNAGKV